MRKAPFGLQFWKLQPTVRGLLLGPVVRKYPTAEQMAKETQLSSSWPGQQEKEKEGQRETGVPQPSLRPPKDLYNTRTFGGHGI